MGQYLDKFASTIGTNQLQQIMRLLNQQKELGQFADIEQFKERMNALMSDLFGTRIVPLLKLFNAIPGDKIDSESWNYMLQRVEEDLQTAFSEALKIDEVLRGHTAVMRDVVLKNMKHAVADLKNKIDVFEYMATSNYGLNTHISSNFAGEGSIRQEREGDFERLFRDPRTGELISASRDTFLDQVGKFLSLPIENNIYATVNNIRQIFDDEAIASEIDAQPTHMKIQNIIDDTVGTYWSHTYLFDTTQKQAPTSVKTKLELSLGGITEINFIEIDPVLTNEITLESIEYVDITGQTLEILDADQPIHQHREKILFRKVAARKIILTFINYTSYPLSFDVEEDDTRLSDSVVAPISKIVGSSGSKSHIVFQGRRFVLGFDNIRVGRSAYLERGIYVSRPMEIQTGGARLFALTSSESRPATTTNLESAIYKEETYDDPDVYTYAGSIEYWLLRDSFDEAGSIIAHESIPVLPVGVERINHERLVLTSKYRLAAATNDAGKLMFYTTVTDGDIKVYRNGSLLSYGVDWLISSELTVTTPGTGLAMSFGIQIADPQITDIFTVSYTPLVSNVQSQDAVAAHHLIVDVTGDSACRSFTDQVILAADSKWGIQIASSLVYLAIILRRNTANKYLTPMVLDYKMMSGVGNADKFGGVLDE